ncbi:energy-coupling factor ABC transporter permease [Bowmanella denitrificans]|uniref:Energy-coupling factor ABC transporter permease n=1 Tax=Bowmanella denitrificans TaxID=366582 RepID=A0ABP3GP98_9ALTE
MFENLTLLQGLAWVGYLGLMLGLFKNMSPTQLLHDRRSQHLIFGSAACLFVLWLFRAGIYDGLNVHFLWLSALTLVLGLRRALLSSFLALLGISLVGKESWAMFGVNGLLGISVPLALSYLIYNLSFHKLPRHFFIYIFLCAFIPGALLISLKMLLLGCYYFIDGIHSWEVVVDNYLILIPLMLFPEAMLNGMTITLLIIYCPTWVYTFYDKYYLQDK